MILDATLLVVMAAVVGVLFVPAIRRSESWRATVTPLASIIGSGFLIVAPLLGHAVGAWAPLAMVGIVVLAYAIGGVLRFNIRHLEGLLESGHRSIVLVERLSDVALAGAYLVSVAFYVRLLASFALHPIDAHAPSWVASAITTAVLAIIGTTALLRGLQGLEWVEETAVHVKLGIIAALLVGLVWSDAGWLGGGSALDLRPVADGTRALRLLAGMLLVVQGFETSRYLAASYAADLRVRSMRHAQWLAGGIYVVFVSLALPLLGSHGEPASETAIIDLSRQVAPILPALLLLAAVVSQLSAAIADTIGSGGLLTEASGRRVRDRIAYAAVISAAIALVWSVDIFAIIAIASRAFAFYYLLQCVGAWMAAGAVAGRARRLALRSGFCALALILALVVIFAIPAEAA